MESMCFFSQLTFRFKKCFLPASDMHMRFECLCYETVLSDDRARTKALGKPLVCRCFNLTEKPKLLSLLFQNVFQLSVESNSAIALVLHWFCIATLCDWLKNLAPLPQPIRSKAVFPRLARATCICFEL